MQMEKAKSWSNPDDWREADCSVLAVGVSCTERDYNRNCDGFKYLHRSHLASTLPQVGPVNFRFQDQSVCPGRFWCAYEGNDCECDGSVIFSVQVMVKGNYVAGDVISEADEVQAPPSGHITCGRDATGNPLKDPSPYSIKSCWCTPKVILDKLKQSEAVYRHPRVCARKTNQDFFDEPITQRRRLEGPAFLGQASEDASSKQGFANEASELHQQAEEEAKTQEEEEEEAKQEEQDEQGDENEEEEEEEDATGLRRLMIHHTSSDSRRRRTYEYTPWALVEVPPNSPDEKPVITCAYKYGTIEAAQGEYHTEGAPGNNLFHVSFTDDDGRTGQRLADSWMNNGGHHTCQVRTNGLAAADTCAVAMEPPAGLAQATAGGYFWMSATNVVAKICCVFFLITT
eukprot:CAMPEP_0206570288 /NCGR_PEP_ID=MMETSP0325_2-20121206/26945_1 /ASSEMBLY_ACC=CAM_ASM_000347 /TAXON_ID=2866 /ORGANISM="Crypthecodinium cohnii, Strain Seligo" /LENGTH=399 /DNA_ID=CAMNT_0054074041 /DNA_START=362 /DNA_END=1557 /DNA_ORIENTATION=+